MVTSPTELTPNLLVMVGLDCTTSNTRCLDMRDKMSPQLLASLRHGDEVHFFPVDERPTAHIEVKNLTKVVGLDQAIVTFYQAIHAIKPATNPKAINNTGAVLRYAKDISTSLATEWQRLASAGQPRRRQTRVVLSVFTDGELPPGQSLPEPGPWPAALDVWFVGVEPPYEAQLKHWLSTTVSLPETQWHLLKSSTWHTEATQVFGPRIGRAFVNTGLLKRLGVS